MLLRFFLLDINYEVRDERPEIRLWGISEDARRVLVIDKSLKPYFYLLLEESRRPEEVLESIKNRVAGSSLSEGLDIRIEEKRYFGRPVKVLKVSLQNPNLLGNYASMLSEEEGVKECLEEDIRYSFRYLIDYGITPCGWLEVEAKPLGTKEGIEVDEIFEAESPPRNIEIPKEPSLRILAFSMVCHSETGSANPAKDPVALISAKTSDGIARQFLAEDKDDRKVLGDFISLIQEIDPDIIVGYGCNRRDWPYLLERCHILGMRLSVDRIGSEPHGSLYGHISITGRANLDLFDFVEDMPEVKVKSLDNIAEYFGILKPQERTVVEEVDIPELWKTPSGRQKVLRWSLENTEAILSIFNALRDFAFQLSNLVGLPLDQVGAAATGFRVESHLMRQAYRFGELIPRRVEKPYIPYQGAVVLEPKKGIHENVAVLDFKALYPSIMIAYNISPDTYIDPEEPEPPQGVYVAPEVGHRFLKEPDGFYRKALKSLIEAREILRKRMEGLTKDSYEYRLLDAKQKAIKIVTNACYGYAGWIGARWYVKPVAEAVTAWGRATILDALKEAKGLGLEVIYSDTDSLFVKNDPDKIETLSKHMQERFGLTLKPDETYVRILFTEAKKRYAGLLPDGRLDIVGLEVARGDWTEAARKVQERVLEIILKERSPDKAAEYVKGFLKDLFIGRIPYKDLILWKTITRDLKDYKVRAPHVEAAKKLIQKGWRLSLGDKVGYVITTKPGSLYDRAEPYILASPKDLDLRYYAEKQIIPAALRVLEQFGVREEDLMVSHTFPMKGRISKGQATLA
jgi:DNA polymerase I